MNCLSKLMLGVVTVGLALPALAAPDTAHPAAQRALSHVGSNAALMRASAFDAFVTRDVVVDNDGAEHVRFDRTYKGLHVIGGDTVVHSHPRAGLKTASHTMRDTLRLETTARFDELAAVDYAQTLFTGKIDRTPSARMVVYARGAQPVMAHDVTVTGHNAEGTPSVLHLILDANSLQLLDKYDEVMTSAANGIGDTLLSGAVTITTDSQSTGGFALRDPLRSNNYTTTLKNRTSGTGTLLTDTDNTWGNFSTSSTVTVATDAHYGLELTWDYYKNMFGRNGIDGSGRTTYSRVHYGTRYVNAFWSDTCFCMSYGDGDGATYLPLVAIDVAGHEMSHGVTASTAKLIYSGESGGLNEANSDIFGTMVEYAANNAKNPPNYLIGERIFAANNGVAVPTTALRFMFKPSLDGASPDCYSANLGSLDVHYSSGVANHFYYLLAEGVTVPAGFTSKLTASQLVCNGNTAIAGIGRDAAARIWYRALTVYMTSNTNYAGARAATLSAAKDLYGTGSAQYNTVASAWSAVSVN
jgi:zinc metalloprotease ZmpA